MNLYWFSDSQGHDWRVFTARTEKRARVLLASSLAVDEIEESYDLDHVTEIGDTEGQVAWILPLEVTFSVFKKPKTETSE
jgi:hypothetical protein